MSWSTSPRLALPLAALIRCVPLAAQGVHAQFGVAGSLTFPTSFYHALPSSGDGVVPGLFGLAMFDLKLPHSPIGVRLDASTGHNSANDSLKTHLTAAVGAPADAQVRLTGVSTDVTYNLQPASALRGYLFAGIGFYNIKVSEMASGVTVDTSATKFAWNVGAGFTIGTGTVAWFLEARYLDVGAFETLKPTVFATTTGIRLSIGK